MPEDGTYRVEKKETEAGTFVEIYDSDYSEDEPAAFLSADDAVEMAKTVFREFGIGSVDTENEQSGGGSR
jgi:hypothetical protein